MLILRFPNAHKRGPFLICLSYESTINYFEKANDSLVYLKKVAQLSGQEAVYFYLV